MFAQVHSPEGPAACCNLRFSDTVEWGGAGRGCSVPGVVLGSEALGIGQLCLCPQKAPSLGTEDNPPHVYLSLLHLTSRVLPPWKRKQGKGETSSFPSSPNTRISHRPVSHT